VHPAFESVFTRAEHMHI